MQECDHQATSKGDPNQHLQAIHEDKNYQATDQSYLSQHQQAIHERIQVNTYIL